MTVPALLVGGDPRHGVVRYALELAAEIGRLTGQEREMRRPPLPGRAHLHFTDRLWGSDPGAAATRVVSLAAQVRLSVTLHDVPQESDGRHLQPRLDCYRRVVGAADAVVCNSDHEAALLARAGIRGQPPPVIIPLPVNTLTDLGPRPSRRHEVAVLGFVYPGKGHAEAIDAISAIPADDRPMLAVLGCASAGHEDELSALSARARRAGVGFSVSGWLTEAQLIRRARAAAVPLAAHRHVSASGSIATWIASGRRPLVADSVYAREIERLRARTVTRYDPRRLVAAIKHALAAPDSTWLPADACTRPDLSDAARAYLRLWAAR